MRRTMDEMSVPRHRSPSRASDVKWADYMNAGTLVTGSKVMHKRQAGEVRFSSVAGVAITKRRALSAGDSSSGFICENVEIPTPNQYPKENILEGWR